LALAWAISNNDVSSCLLGCSKVEQVDENIKALELYRKWTPEIEKRCEEILGNTPEQELDWRTWAPMESRRQIGVKKALCKNACSK